jgi:EAL domain-containing protein (putative c-di-GMP-specific phosphodiesterase class I)
VALLGVIEKPITPQKLRAALQPPQPGGGERAPRARVPLTLAEIQETHGTFSLVEIEAGLRKNEFEPFFQPRVHVGTGCIAVAEALARWRHPEMGRVAPHAFIKPLEDSGRIDELTWLMVRKAAACCREWRASGVDTRVAVRLPTPLLADARLSDRVTELVAGQELEPAQMVVEVAGSAGVLRTGNALENLARLRMRGFGLCVNDYGNPSVSLKHLRSMGGTELKVEQAFARQAASEKSDRENLRAMLEAARAAGVVSVVEGVETNADWDLVVTLGFDFAQGYFVAAPMDAPAYADFMRTCAGRHSPRGSCR